VDQGSTPESTRDRPLCLGKRPRPGVAACLGLQRTSIWPKRPVGVIDSTFWGISGLQRNRRVCVQRPRSWTSYPSMQLEAQSIQQHTSCPVGKTGFCSVTEASGPKGCPLVKPRRMRRRFSPCPGAFGRPTSQFWEVSDDRPWSLANASNGSSAEGTSGGVLRTLPPVTRHASRLSVMPSGR